MSKNLPVKTQPTNDLLALADEGRELIGTLTPLKFAKGDWTKGFKDEETPVGATAQFVVDVLSYERGWVRWENKQPTFRRMGRKIDGFIQPTKNELPERDESSWPYNNRGERQDPWQETFQINLRDINAVNNDDDGLVTFTTTSWGGRKALGTVIKTYAREASKHPGCMPVVLLNSRMRPTDFGEQPTPVLKIVYWQPFGEGAAPPGAASMPAPATQPQLPTDEVLTLPTKSDQPLHKDLDDDIPF